MKRYFLSLLFFVWSFVLFSQTEADFSGTIDTLQMELPESITKDTAYARDLLKTAKEFAEQRSYKSAYALVDTARQIYNNATGDASSEKAQCLNQMGVYKFNSNNFDSAILLFFKSLEIRLKNFEENYDNIVDLYINLGSSYNEKGNYDLALLYYRRALDVLKEMQNKDISDEARAYASMGTTYNIIGKTDSAIFCNQKAVSILNEVESDDNSNYLAGFYNNLGNNYFQKADLNNAIEYYIKSLELKLKLLGENDPDVGGSYLNIGIINTVKGDYNEAIRYNNKALRTFLNTIGKNHPATSWVYNNLGVCYGEKGDYEKAIDCHNKSLRIRLNIWGENHPTVAESYSNLGNCFGNKKEYEKSTAYSQKALDVYIKTIGENNSSVAATYNNIGINYDRQGSYDRAIEYLLKSLTIRQNIFEENHPDVVNSLMNIGINYSQNNDFMKGLEYQFKALEKGKSNLEENNHVVGTIYNNIGTIYYRTNSLDTAVSYYKKCLSIRRVILGSTHPLTIEVLYELLAGYKKSNKLDSAQIYADLAMDAIRQQIISDVTVEAKSLFQSQNLPVFESAIDLAVERSKEKQDRSLSKTTFSYSEMSKSTLLQLQTKQNDALSFSGIPDSLLQKEKDNRLAINYREKQRQNLLESGKTETDTLVLSISSVLFDLKRQQEDLLSNFEKNYPDYYRLKYDLTTVSLEETQQKLLQPGQCLLEYFVGDSSIFPMVITKDTFAVLKIKKDFALDSLVSALQGGLYGYYSVSKDMQTDDLYKSSIKSYISSSTELYRRLVQPVGHLLTRDVIIAPDGVLGYIPFEALLDKQPEDPGRFEAYPYFIRDHKVSYTYSATLLKEMKDRKHKKQPQKNLAGFAPFYTGSYAWLDSTINIVFDTLDDGRDTTLFRSVVTRKDFMPLPYSGEEVFSAAKLLKGDYFINRDATEQKFYEVAGDYRIVHLATHGVADSRQGDYSYLAFAEQKDSIENEFLYVRDIYNTSLNADLVVLSACETARGELQRGEGIISLARAFAYAGAKSMLTTLWVVDDVAIKDIMKDFYSNLHRGQEKDTALRNAKLNHLTRSKSRYRHPFFWAGLIGIGDMTKL